MKEMAYIQNIPNTNVSLGEAYVLLSFVNRSSPGLWLGWALEGILGCEAV